MLNGKFERIIALIPKPPPGSFNDRAEIPTEALIAIAEIIHPREFEILISNETEIETKKEGDK